MKLTHLTLAALWAFAVTVEAQGYGDYPKPAGGGAVPWNNPQEHLYTDPQYPLTPPGRYRQREILIPRHPDDGALSEAPYISVPVQPSYGHGYQEYGYGW